MELRSMTLRARSPARPWAAACGAGWAAGEDGDTGAVTGADAGDVPRGEGAAPRCNGFAISITAAVIPPAARKVARPISTPRRRRGRPGGGLAGPGRTRPGTTGAAGGW